MDAKGVLHEPGERRQLAEAHNIGTTPVVLLCALVRPAERWPNGRRPCSVLTPNSAAMAPLDIGAAITSEMEPSSCGVRGVIPFFYTLLVFFCGTWGAAWGASLWDASPRGTAPKSSE